MTSSIIKTCTAVCFLVLSLSVHAEVTETGQDIFARVNDSVITVNELKQALYTESRNRFYHGKPSENEVESFQREIADQLVTNLLLVQEARRRGIVHDASQLNRSLENVRAKLNRSNRSIDENSELWQSLVNQYIEAQLAASLEKQVRGAIPAPDESALREYYKSHPEKFTEPPRNRIATILLSVEPSAGKDAWEAAMTEAKDIAARINNGADFSEMAKIHSSDSSAEEGGDMGYLHRGILTDDIQQKINDLEVGAITEPLVVLEGVVIMKLLARDGGGLQSFENVRNRVSGLLSSEKRDAYWNEFVQSLRTQAKISMDESYLTLEGKGTQ